MILIVSWQSACHLEQKLNKENHKKAALYKNIERQPATKTTTKIAIQITEGLAVQRQGRVGF